MSEMKIGDYVMPQAAVKGALVVVSKQLLADARTMVPVDTGALRWAFDPGATRGPVHGPPSPPMLGPPLPSLVDEGEWLAAVLDLTDDQRAVLGELIDAARSAEMDDDW